MKKYAESGPILTTFAAINALISMLISGFLSGYCATLMPPRADLSRVDLKLLLFPLVQGRGRKQPHQLISRCRVMSCNCTADASVMSNGTLRKGVINSHNGRYVDLMSALCRTVVGRQPCRRKMKGDTLSQR